MLKICVFLCQVTYTYYFFPCVILWKPYKYIVNMLAAVLFTLHILRCTLSNTGTAVLFTLHILRCTLSHTGTAVLFTLHILRCTLSHTGTAVLFTLHVLRCTLSHTGTAVLFTLHVLRCTLSHTGTAVLTPLTLWSRVLLEKLTVNFAASQEIPRIYGTRKFLTVPTVLYPYSGTYF
jgi:hypothetical protein